MDSFLPKQIGATFLAAGLALGCSSAGEGPEEAAGDGGAPVDATDDETVDSTGGDSAVGSWGQATSGGAFGGGGAGSGGEAAAGGAELTGGAQSTGGGAGTGGADSSGGATAAGGSSGGTDPGASCDETSGLPVVPTFYVSPGASVTGTGKSFADPINVMTAISAAEAGDTIVLQPGTYVVPYSAGQKNTLVLSQSGTELAPITIVAANCGRAVFDFSFPEQQWVQDSFGFHVTGSYWTFKGIEVTRAGYQGVYVTGAHNTFDTCSFYENRNTGLEINKGGSYTTVIHCDAFRNYDPKKYGSMADGFGPKQTQGPGNVFIDCRAWENSDDGFDAYDSPEVVVIEDSWAFRNGVDVWNYGGFAGNGNGFKLGGNQALARNVITGSVAFGNPQKGFDQNNNAGGLTVLNCTAFDNGTNFGLGNPVYNGEQHTIRNNISLGASVSIANAAASHNSWNAGFAVSASDFVSLSLSQATAERRPDGSLPEMTVFRLKPESPLVDAGLDVGAGFSGEAPDLGAFEFVGFQ